MRRIPITGLIFLCGYMAVMSQISQVTFTTSSDSIAVDSVLATNLHTNQSIMLPGNKALILEHSSSTEYLLHSEDEPVIYPNPFKGNTTINFDQVRNGNVIIAIYNHTGQQIFHTQNYLDAGGHSFILSLNRAGIYFVTFSMNHSQSVLTAICTETGNSVVDITHIGYHQNNNVKSGDTSDGQQNEYKIAYSPDQVMHFKCFGDNYTTIMTDHVESAINYEVEFYDCTDIDGRTYNVVKIGNQLWMEENLAYLPDVFPSSQGSDTIKYFYVSDYEGSSLEEAKSTDQYRKYGVLYNWYAALDGDTISDNDTTMVQGICPDGWHLPSNAEWNELNSNYEIWYNNLRSTEDWNAGWNGNNRTGFNAYPGGYRSNVGFHEVHSGALFWTSKIYESEEPSWKNTAWVFQLLIYGQIGQRGPQSHFNKGHSVRCLKNE